MQAIVYSEYGPPDGLRLEEAPKPAPKEDEVLVKVHAASVNSWDVDLLLGRPYLNRMGVFRKPKYPILGADIAGVIEAVGSNVERFEPGDEVFGDISGCHWGGYAEYVCARADVLAHKSASMSFEQAASLPQAGVLAVQGLRYGGEVEPGQEVLFNGAGGGVGTHRRADRQGVRSGSDRRGQRRQAGDAAIPGRGPRYRLRKRGLHPQRANL